MLDTVGDRLADFGEDVDDIPRLQDQARQEVAQAAYDVAWGRR